MKVKFRLMARLFDILVILLIFLAWSLPAGAEEAPAGMVPIKGGCYMMGTNEVHFYELGWENISERPAHKVCVDDFFLDQDEISQKEFQKIMGYNRSQFKGDDLPVDRITWEEAVKYCRKVGKRLPWEAEWEYAARAGAGEDKPWTGKVDDAYVWFARNSMRRPQPVGSKKPNPWGLHDMMGSVWEWVQDWYSLDYYQHSPVKNPKGPKTRQSWHVIRGLSWVDERDDFHVSLRLNGQADRTETFFVGARCAKTPSQ